MAHQYVYIKGQFVPEDNALISIHERGFRLGDGVFETIRVVKGKPYQLQSHMERLIVALNIVKIKLTEEIKQLPAIVEQIIEKNTIRDGIVRCSVSRGIGPRGYLPVADIAATCVVEATPGLPQPLVNAQLWATHEYHSYGFPCKLMQCLPYILSKMEAAQQGCIDALLFHAKGWVAETSSANIFWVYNKKLFTPHINTGIIAGVMRKRLIEMSPYPIEEGKYNFEHLCDAQEVFITNVSYLVTPIHAIKHQGQNYTFEPNGEVTAELTQLLHEDSIKN